MQIKWFHGFYTILLITSTIYVWVLWLSDSALIIGKIWMKKIKELKFQWIWGLYLYLIYFLSRVFWLFTQSFYMAYIHNLTHFVKDTAVRLFSLSLTGRVYIFTVARKLGIRMNSEVSLICILCISTTMMMAEFPL